MVGYVLEEFPREMHCVVAVMGRGPGFAADINKAAVILHVCPHLHEKQDGVVS